MLWLCYRRFWLPAVVLCARWGHHRNLTMERCPVYRLEYVAPAALRVQGETDRVMSAIENFFLELGASIQRRAKFSIEAEVVHPDGFVVRLYVKYDTVMEADVVEIRRRSGEAALFDEEIEWTIVEV